MNLVKVEVSEGSYILPPQVMDIKLVRIISSINKPLDQLTIRDICAWHEDTEKYVEYSIKLPDQYTKTVEYSDVGFRTTYVTDKFPKPTNIYNPLGIKVGDKISSDLIKGGAILKCIGLTEDEEFLTWEGFTGDSGNDRTSFFKKYTSGVDQFITKNIPQEKPIPNSAKSMGYFITDDGNLLVNVAENVFKRGDYLHEDIYIKDIFKYANHYGLVLDIDTNIFSQMGYPNYKVNGNVFLTNVQNDEFVTGLLIKPNIIIQSVFKNEQEPGSIIKIRIYEKSFIVNKTIFKFSDKNFYNGNN